MFCIFSAVPVQTCTSQLKSGFWRCVLEILTVSVWLEHRGWWEKLKRNHCVLFKLSQHLSKQTISHYKCSGGFGFVISHGHTRSFRHPARKLVKLLFLPLTHALRSCKFLEMFQRDGMWEYSICKEETGFVTMF